MDTDTDTTTSGMVAIFITEEEWETLKRQVAEMHEFMSTFATQMESLGSAMGNPAALMQMIMGGRKPKRTGT